MNAVSKKKTPQAAANLSPVPPRISPVHGGLSVAGIYQLIEQIRDADHERDLRHMKRTKEDFLEAQRNEAHRNLLWDYQMALASVAAFLKPNDMRDALGMLRLLDDHIERLVEDDHEENGINIIDELSSLHRMVRGCLAVVANDLGIILHPTTQHLVQKDFPEVPR
jgi:hypothetical protein